MVTQRLPVVLGQDSRLDADHRLELVEQALLDEESELAHPRLFDVERGALITSVTRFTEEQTP